MRHLVSIASALSVGALLLGCNSNNSSGAGGNGNASGGNGGGSNNASVGSGTGSSCAAIHSDLQVSNGNASEPAIAWNGHDFGIAYQDLTSDAGDIRFALVDGDGNVKTTSAIETDSNTSSLPTVVTTSGGAFLVLWQDNDGTGSIVKGRNVDSSGTAQGDAFSVTSSADAQARPGGVSASGGVAITWADTSSMFLGLLAGTNMQKKTTFASGEAAAIAANGDDLGVVWAMTGKLGFARVSPPYTSGSQSSISVDGHVPRVAADGKGGFFVAWEDWRTGSDSPSIFASHVDGSGNASSPVQVESVGTGANYPDVAFSGDHAGVVYYQFRDGPPAIFFTQLNTDLSRDGADLQVSGSATSGSKYARIAWNGSVFGVTYADVDGAVKLTLLSCK